MPRVKSQRRPPQAEEADHEARQAAPLAAGPSCGRPPRRPSSAAGATPTAIARTRSATSGGCGSCVSTPRRAQHDMSLQRVHERPEEGRHRGRPEGARAISRCVIRRRLRSSLTRSARRSKRRRRAPSRRSVRSARKRSGRATFGTPAVRISHPVSRPAESSCATRRSMLAKADAPATTRAAARQPTRHATRRREGQLRPEERAPQRAQGRAANAGGRTTRRDARAARSTHCKRRSRRRSTQRAGDAQAASAGGCGRSIPRCPRGAPGSGAQHPVTLVIDEIVRDLPRAWLHGRHSVPRPRPSGTTSAR